MEPVGVVLGLFLIVGGLIAIGWLFVVRLDGTAAGVRWIGGLAVAAVWSLAVAALAWNVLNAGCLF